MYQSLPVYIKVSLPSRERNLSRTVLIRDDCIRPTSAIISVVDNLIIRWCARNVIDVGFCPYNSVMRLGVSTWVLRGILYNSSFSRHLKSCAIRGTDDDSKQKCLRLPQKCANYSYICWAKPTPGCIKIIYFKSERTCQFYHVQYTRTRLKICHDSCDSKS